MTDVAATMPAVATAALAGAAQGARAAGQPDLLDDLLAVTEIAAAADGFEPTAFREAGCAVMPLAGPGVLPLRGIPFGLLSPLDRPRLRRGAYRCAALAPAADEASLITAVAVAILTADLARGFDLETACIRCRQSLLEEAPMALLDALTPVPAPDPVPEDQDPISTLRAAVTALNRGTDLDSVLGALLGGSRGASLVLAGAFAGIRSPAAIEPPADLPQADRVASVARLLGDRAARHMAGAGETRG